MQQVNEVELEEYFECGMITREEVIERVHALLSKFLMDDKLQWRNVRLQAKSYRLKSEGDGKNAKV